MEWKSGVCLQDFAVMQIEGINIYTSDVDSSGFCRSLTLGIKVIILLYYYGM